MAERGKHVYEFESFRLDLRERLLLRAGKPVPLTPKAFDTLVVLIQNSGRLLLKDDMMKALWPHCFVEEVNLSQNISMLRKALGETAHEQRYIVIVPGSGYRFTAEVRDLSEAAKKQNRVVSRDPAPPVIMRRRVARITALALPLVLLLAGFLGRHRFWPQVNPSSSRIMLAVLPFQNLSGDPLQEYFSDGLTEEMITQLGSLHPERLVVIARTSAMKYKSTQKSTAQIGRELRVDYILEGSVRRAGDRVRISAQLIRVRDQTHLWARNYESDMRDIFRVQSDVAQDTANEIRVALSPREQAHFATSRQVDPEAYQLYLRGLHAWNRGPGEGAATSQKFFQEAVEKDSKFALAYVGLAFGHNLNGEYQLAKDPARKALRLDDSLASAHAALAFGTYGGDWDFATAGSEYQRAIQLGPNDPTTLHTYALYLASLGQIDEAIEEMRRALELDPLSPLTNTNLAGLYWQAGHEKEAILQGKSALEIAPNFSYAHAVLGSVQRGPRLCSKNRAGGLTCSSVEFPASVFLRRRGQRIPPRQHCQGVFHRSDVRDPKPDPEFTLRHRQHTFFSRRGYVRQVPLCSESGDGVSAFTVDSASGALTPVIGSPFLAGTAPISVTTTGKIQ